MGESDVDTQALTVGQRIAEHLFGQVPGKLCSGTAYTIYPSEYPPYVSDEMWWTCRECAAEGDGFAPVEHVCVPKGDYAERIENAWQVVDALHERGWVMELESGRGDPKTRWRCLFASMPQGNASGWLWSDAEGYAATAPEAICQAALKALGCES